MRNLRYVAVVLLLIYLLTGVRQIRPGERAVVRRFGRVLDEKPRPGLWIGLPWGIDVLDRVPVDLIQRVQLGFDPSAREEDEQATSGQFLTGDQNLVNMQVVLEYSVDEDEVVKYVVQKDQVDGLIARAAETVLSEWAAGLDVDFILLNGKAELPEILVRRTQRRIENYGLGIRIRDASVTNLAPPDQVKADFEKVNQAQTEVQTATYKAEQESSRRLGEADSERDRILKEADAFTVEQLESAGADAANFLKRLNQYHRFRKTNPDYLHDLWIAQMRRVYAKLKAKGGRIEPLDKLMGKDGIDLWLDPFQEKR